MNRRHRLHDRRCKDSAHPVNRIVVDVAGADGQVHDFAGAHEDALEGRLVTSALDAFDGLDDKRRGDLIDLSAAKWSDDVALHAAALILVADDATALEVLPKRPSVAECVATWRFLAELFALAPGDLASLHKTQLWPMAKCKIRDATAM